MTTRVIYDVRRFHHTRSAKPNEPDAWQPVFAASITRVLHMNQLAPDQESDVELGFSYSDGLGREIQKKLDADPGQLEDGREAKPLAWGCAKDAEDNEIAEASASYRNLTRLFRFASLTRVLGMPYRDVKKLYDLIGIDPFASPIESLRFLQRSMELSASRLSVWEWDYLKGSDARAGAGIGLEDDQLDSIWRDLNKESASTYTLQQGDDPSTRLVEPLKSEDDFDAQIKTLIAGLGVTGDKAVALCGLVKGATSVSDSHSQKTGWRQLIGELPDIFPQAKAAEDELIPFKPCDDNRARIEKWKGRWSFVGQCLRYSMLSTSSSLSRVRGSESVVAPSTHCLIGRRNVS